MSLLIIGIEFTNTIKENNLAHSLVWFVLYRKLPFGDKSKK